MNFRFQNLLGAPYRGGNTVISNNTLLISPVGNRISVTDLVKSQTTTLPTQSSSNISRIAVSPDGTFLFTVDEKSRCQFINLHRRIVLHRISFKKPVSVVKFSPDGSLVAVGAGKLVQVWRSPGFRKEYFPFELVRTFANFGYKITALDWSPDSNYLIVGSKDLTARLLYLKKLRGDVKYKPFMLLGQRDSVVGAFFGVDKKTNRVCKAYTISRDCYIFSWIFRNEEGDINKMDDGGSEPPSPGTPDRDVEGNVETDDNDNDNIKKRKNFDGKDAEMLEEGGYLCTGKWEL